MRAVERKAVWCQVCGRLRGRTSHLASKDGTRSGGVSRPLTYLYVPEVRSKVIGALTKL